jgi:hypothetical protein
VCEGAVACWGDFEVESEEDHTEVHACSSIEGDLAVVEQAWLSSLALPCLTTVGGDLLMIENEAMTGVGDLSSLTTVGGDMDVGSNMTMTTLEGLSSLTYVGGFLHIYRNDALSSVDALSSLTYVGNDLLIQENGQLCQTDAEAFASGVDVMDTVFVSGNGGTCD